MPKRILIVDDDPDVLLMLTGRDQPVDKLYGFAHGADSYLTLPFDDGELTPLGGA